MGPSTDLLTLVILACLLKMLLTSGLDQHLSRMVQIGMIPSWAPFQPYCYMILRCSYLSWLSKQQHSVTLLMPYFQQWLYHYHFSRTFPISKLIHFIYLIIWYTFQDLGATREKIRMIADFSQSYKSRENLQNIGERWFFQTAFITSFKEKRQKRIRLGIVKKVTGFLYLQILVLVPIKKISESWYIKVASDILRFWELILVITLSEFCSNFQINAN